MPSSPAARQPHDKLTGHCEPHKQHQEHPAVLRWIVLAFSCFLLMGNYYCFDNPAALKSQLQQHFGAYSRDAFEMRFNLLYTLYSIPNTVLPFFGGAFVDRFGIDTALVLFSTLILLGQIVLAAGSSLESFDAMLIGRFIVGLGGESLSVAQGALVVEWFNNEEIAFAMGLNLSISRFGSVINNELSPIIAKAASVSVALWVGVLMCLVSCASVLAIVWINHRYVAQQQQSVVTQDAIEREPKRITLRDVQDFQPSVWLLVVGAILTYGCVVPFNSVASSLLMERDYFQQPPPACRRCGEGAYAELLNCTTIAPACPSVAPFAWPLPKLSANCSIAAPHEQLACARAPPYITDAQINCDDDAWRRGPLTQTYCEKKTRAAEAAATPMSIPYLISATVSPFLGFAVDRVGLRALLNLVAAAVLIIAHTLLALTRVTPFVPLVLQGVAYTVFAAVVWPSIPLVVEEHHIGTGYGVLTAAMNIGLTVFPIAVATLYEHANRYIPSVELFFVALATIGLLNAVVLNVYDWKHHSILNRSATSETSETPLPSSPSSSPTETTPLLSNSIEDASFRKYRKFS